MIRIRTGRERKEALPMTTQSALAPPAPARPPHPHAKRFSANPASAGLPDPRPLTDYDAVYEEVDGNSKITVTLAQPCVIRNPAWTFIDCTTGESVLPAVVKPNGVETIVFDFTGIIPNTVCFVDVPYQDMQVQNFQGGFVRPGGKWFSRGK